MDCVFAGSGWQGRGLVTVPLYVATPASDTIQIQAGKSKEV